MDVDEQRAVRKVVMAMSASAIVKRRRMTRLQIMQEVAGEPCVCGADPGGAQGKYYTMMKEVLRANGLDGPFQQAIMEAIIYGRDKERNVFCIGKTNCAKSFLTKPLQKIYRVFVPPDPAAEPSYPLANLLGKEVLLFSEFEWSPVIISWEGLKNLFEGNQTLTVAQAQNISGRHIEWDSDAPCFGSARNRISHPRLEDETEQMTNRLKYFDLVVPYVGGARKQCKLCGPCAAKCYLEGEEAALAAPPEASSSSSATPAAAAAAAAPASTPPRGTGSILHQISRLHAMKRQGAVDTPEFKALKAGLLREAGMVLGEE